MKCSKSKISAMLLLLCLFAYTKQSKSQSVIDEFSYRQKERCFYREAKLFIDSALAQPELIKMLKRDYISDSVHIDTNLCKKQFNRLVEIYADSVFHYLYDLAKTYEIYYTTWGYRESMSYFYKTLDRCRNFANTDQTVNTVLCFPVGKGIFIPELTR